MVVGLPAATVTRCSPTCWKKRLAENFSAITSVAPRLIGTRTPRSCADAQLNERKSYTRSSGPMPKPSAVGSMLPRCSRKFSTTPLGRALVPEVNRMTASSSGPAVVCASLRSPACDRLVEGAGRGTIPLPERQFRGGNRREQVVELQTILKQHQLRPEPRKNVGELVAVHLHVDGADRGAVGHDADIAEEMLDRIVGKERDSVVPSEAALAQERRDARGHVVQLAIADGAAVAGRNDPGLARIATRRAGNPVLQAPRVGMSWRGHRPNYLAL